MINPSYIDITRAGAIVDDLRNAETKAYSAFDAAFVAPVPSEYDTIGNAAVEVFGLNELKRLVIRDFEAASSEPNGFAKSEQGPDGEFHPLWMGRFRQYLKALETVGGAELGRSVTKDLTEILRATEYPITDKDLFGAVPQSEDDVHRRIEGVLRCVFPDLKRKPQLTKPIKNFEPDTGLPSIQTLIEYKFLGAKVALGGIADQILADTRGYNSRDWTTFVYVIYETNRFRPESEWNLLLRDCGVASSASVIVLSGEPAAILKPR
jgi:hypothetical protein